MDSWVEAGGVSIRYRIEGKSGPLVVLLHEMGGSLESWDEVVPVLLDAGARVLRYDQRGSGASEKPRGEIEQRRLAADLAAVLDAVAPNGPWNLVAVAAAALSALTVAAQRPDGVTGLVLCNPVTGVSAERADALRERAALAESGGMRRALASTLDRSWPAELGDPSAYARYRARYLGNDPVCFAAHNRALIGVDVTAAVAALRCPVLVLAGRADQVRTPESSQAFAATIPNARFELVDSGHMMPPQAPAELAARVRDFVFGHDREPTVPVARERVP